MALPARKTKAKLKPPRSQTKKLIEAKARASILRDEVEEKRNELRIQMVDDHLKVYGVAAIQGDLDGSKRLSALRKKLGLDTAKRWAAALLQVSKLLGGPAPARSSGTESCGPVLGRSWKVTPPK